jgi:hypothetical protein
MSTSPHDYRRPMLLNAVRGLISEARAERGALHLSSPDRTFYLGVEAAAEEVLHPELGCAREEHWLDREAPPFRSGYLETQALLAAAVTADEPPHHLRLPDPSAARR